LLRCTDVTRKLIERRGRRLRASPSGATQCACRQAALRFAERLRLSRRPETVEFIVGGNTPRRAAFYFLAMNHGAHQGSKGHSGTEAVTGIDLHSLRGQDRPHRGRKEGKKEVVCGCDNLRFRTRGSCHRMSGVNAETIATSSPKSDVSAECSWPTAKVFAVEGSHRRPGIPAFPPFYNSLMGGKRFIAPVGGPGIRAQRAFGAHAAAQSLCDGASGGGGRAISGSTVAALDDRNISKPGVWIRGLLRLESCMPGRPDLSGSTRRRLPTMADVFKLVEDPSLRGMANQCLYWRGP